MTSIRIAALLTSLMGAALPTFDMARADPRGPVRKREPGRYFWPKSTKGQRSLDSGMDAYGGTYNVGRNAHKRSRRMLERSLRADAVARSGGVKVPKHRLAC